MSIFNKIIEGMVADIMYEDGYRKDETELSLEEAVSCPMYVERCLILGVHSTTFTNNVADRLNKQGISLGVIEQPLQFPNLTKKEPDINWRRAYTYSYKYKNKSPLECRPELVSLNEVGNVVFTDLNLNPSNTISLYLDLLGEEELLKHLKSGYCAAIQVIDGEAYWVDVPSFYLSRLWDKELAEYHKMIGRWEWLGSTIYRAIEFNAALEQQFSMAALPFKWHAGKYDIEFAKTHKVSYDAFHATHLIAKEGFVSGDYHLITGDFLCLGDGSQAGDSHENPLEYVCEVEGVVLKRVPHIITCNRCRGHIDKLLQLLGTA